MTWTDLSGAFGYGTKLTSTQMQNLRDNLTALANGDSGAPPIQTAALDTGIVTEAKIGAAAIAQSKLKTSSGSVSQLGAVLTNKTLPGGEYGFYPQIKMENTTSQAWKAQISKNDAAYAGWTTYTTNIALQGTSSLYIYAQQRYVTSSGEIFWIFVLRDKASRAIISMWQAPDHPCFGNGGKPELVSHPFGDYDPARHEIVVINPSMGEVRAIQKATVIPDGKQANRDFLEALLKIYDIDEALDAPWPDAEVTVALPPDWDKAWISGKPIQLIKKKIPRPIDMLCRSLKLRT